MLRIIFVVWLVVGAVVVGCDIPAFLPYKMYASGVMVFVLFAIYNYTREAYNSEKSLREHYEEWYNRAGDDIKKLEEQYLKTIARWEEAVDRRMHLILFLTQEPRLLRFYVTWFNEGNTLSQEAMAEILGVTRSEIRKVAAEVNTAAREQLIVWGNPAVTTNCVEADGTVRYCGICGKPLKLGGWVEDAECGSCCREHYRKEV